MAATSNVQLVVTAKDEASKTLKKVGVSLDGIAKAGKVVAQGVAVAGAAIAAFSVSSIRAFAESEKQTAKSLQKINNALEGMSTKGLNALQKIADKANGEGADIFEFAEKSIMAAADAAVQLGFDDEDTADSIATLFQRTGDLNEAMRLNTIAMDIARGKGIELSEANRVVNMVLSGSTRELKLMGIEVDDNATGIDNLRSVQERYAGQSQAFAQTTAGKLEILSKSWGNVKESVGKALVEGLKVNEWLDKLSKFVSSEGFQNGIVKLGTGISSAVKMAVSAVKTLTSALESVFYVMFRSIDIAVGMWKDLKTTVNSTVTSIKSAWEGLKSTLSKPITSFINIVQSVSNKKKKKALGGGVNAGESYIVGEHRPEVFVPSQSGNIKQLDQVGGGKIEVNFNNVNVRSDYDLQTIISAVKETLARDKLHQRYGVTTM